MQSPNHDQVSSGGQHTSFYLALLHKLHIHAEAQETDPSYVL